MSDPAPDSERYLQDADMSEVETGPFAGGEVAWFSARCPERDSGNQDAAALLPIGADTAVLAVADGAGGGHSGARAAQLAVAALGRAVEAGRREELLPRTAILNGFEQANQAVCDLGVGAATTLAVAEIRGDRMRPYHVGDSLILLVGQRGKVKLESVSHSPVGFAVEAGVLDRRDALHHEDRHLVSNILGAADMRIEIGSERALAPRDTLVIASDGLSDNLHVREIAERARRGPLRDAAEALAATARRRMYTPEDHEPSKPDDLTLLVFRPRATRAGRGAGSSASPRS